MENNPVLMKQIMQELELREKVRKKKKSKKSKKKKKKSKKEKKSRAGSSSESRSERKKKKKSKKKGKSRSRSRSKSKKSKKSRSTSASSHNDDRMFNNFVKRRLGPLVEFDEESYRLRFTARHKFKNNDRKKMSKAEQEDLLNAMKRNAEMYEKKKLDVHLLECAEGKEDAGSGKPSFLQEYSKEALLGDGRDKLAENVRRGRFFQDRNVVRRDDHDV